MLLLTILKRNILKINKYNFITIIEFLFKKNMCLIIYKKVLLLVFNYDINQRLKSKKVESIL